MGLNFGVLPRAKLDRIDHQPHRRLGRIDVFLLRDVFLQDVVLQRAGELFPVSALLFRHGQIHRPNRRGGRVDGHRRRHVRQRNLIEQRLHIRQRTDRHAAFADFPLRQRMIGVVPISVGRSNATDSPVWPCERRYRKRRLVSSAVPNPANWRMVHSRAAIHLRDGCRGCKEARPESRGRVRRPNQRGPPRCRADGSGSPIPL